MRVIFTLLFILALAIVLIASLVDVYKIEKDCNSKHGILVQIGNQAKCVEPSSLIFK